MGKSKEARRSKLAQRTEEMSEEIKRLNMEVYDLNTENTQQFNKICELTRENITLRNQMERTNQANGDYILELEEKVRTLEAELNKYKAPYLIKAFSEGCFNKVRIHSGAFGEESLG